MDYEEQATQFAYKYGVALKILSSEWKKHFHSDTECRRVFKCKLSREGKHYVFKFGQSIMAGMQEPTMYDILSCLTKSDVGTLEDFAADFGFELEDKNTKRVYNAVQREYKAVERLFGDIIEDLQEIA